MSQAQLLPAGEIAWLRLKSHLEWMDEFGLGFIFSAYPKVLSIFRARLSYVYRARVSHFEDMEVTHPEQLLDEILPRLLEPPSHESAVGAPRWLDLSTQTSADWVSARLNFLARLNERRERLRTGLQRPLLLVLPSSERERIQTLIPDLWAIRDVVVELEQWLVDGPVFREPRSIKKPVVALDAAGEKIVKEWERQKRIHPKGALPACFKATSVLLNAGRLKEANVVAQAGLVMAKQLGRDRTTGALWNLACSLGNVGKVAQKMGNLEAAIQVFGEGLQLLRNVVNDKHDASNDLAVMLRYKGETANELEDYTAAKQILIEGLEVARKIEKQKTSVKIQMLIVAILMEIGKVEERLGNLEEAKRMLTESLTLARQLGKSETPEALRNISVIMNSMGILAKTTGDYEEAKIRFTESLALSQQLLRHEGETPAVLYNMAAAQYHLGSIHLILGDRAQAGQILGDGLSLARMLATKIPDNPEFKTLPAAFEQTLQTLSP